jgi:hypothetical protein
VGLGPASLTCTGFRQHGLNLAKAEIRQGSTSEPSHLLQQQALFHLEGEGSVGVHMQPFQRRERPEINRSMESASLQFRLARSCCLGSDVLVDQVADSFILLLFNAAFYLHYSNDVQGGYGNQV